MELLEHLPGGPISLGGLVLMLAFVIVGFVKRAIKLALAGLALFLALGGWAYVEAASESAEAAIERAKEAAERVEKEARKVEKRVKALD